jgi:hypothetical protein
MAVPVLSAAAIDYLISDNYLLIIFENVVFLSHTKRQTFKHYSLADLADFPNPYLSVCSNIFTLNLKNRIIKKYVDVNNL